MQWKEKKEKFLSTFEEGDDSLREVFGTVEERVKWLVRDEKDV
jgi:hypothetical protein